VLCDTPVQSGPRRRQGRLLTPCLVDNSFVTARIVALAALAAVLSAQDVKQIDIPTHPGQSYALFVPSTYSADRRWPILYCLDPGARGRNAVERFAAAAEKAGFLVAGSNNSRNGPIQPSLEAIRLMVQDTHDRFSIDDARAAEIAVAVRPENANAWYSLAVAQAAGGDTRHALDSLEQAAAKGFRGWDRADNEPLLAKLRRDPRYLKLAGK